MNKLAVARQPRPLLPELSEFFTGFPVFGRFPLGGLMPLLDGHLLRLEDEVIDGRYEVRAEMPGVDPDNDVTITVRDGQLTIRAERTQRGETNGRSEFTYGSLRRSVSLPVGAAEDDISASYDRGILTVSVPLSQPESPEKQVPIHTAQ